MRKGSHGEDREQYRREGRVVASGEREPAQQALSTCADAGGLWSVKTPAELLEPVDEAGVACDGGRDGVKEPLECQDELASARRLPAREAPVVRQDQALVVVAVGNAVVVNRDEVTLVVGDEHSILSSGPREEIFVGSAAQVGALCDGDHIVIALAKLLSDRRCVHLVQQQLQASAACSRRHAVSAASASSSLRVIHSSISAG